MLSNVAVEDELKKRIDERHPGLINSATSLSALMRRNIMEDISANRAPQLPSPTQQLELRGRHHEFYFTSLGGIGNRYLYSPESFFRISLKYS